MAAETHPMPDSAPQSIRLDDYRVPDFLVDTVNLSFDLFEDGATVTSKLEIRRNPQSGRPTAPLVLDGHHMELVSVAVNGEALGDNRYAVDAHSLTLSDMPDNCTLEIITRIEPHKNTALEGLYTSGGNFCTQCEAEGFRRITYFLDRPDVMARYSTTIIADRAKYPVLLSNGNLAANGDAGQDRHWARWDDPWPKPSYLFALVAGDLVPYRDSFTIRSGRKVPLEIYVRHGDEEKCEHAMRSLKNAMAWDEEVYGLEYDLERFMIVAVSDFNMGAMENKGLNIFNSKYVLASAETATDSDYANIEGIIGHEYFHNWTGNRVTCRDWFQLSLKEGLTVFRDQQFSADMGSAAVKRILDVRRLRATQFPEDAGPTAHPVRPESYIEINNFYTPTVYVKGAEVVRMIHTLIGATAFRAGMDLYFERHDGQAVSIEDFVKAMEDASGTDLARFRRWYAQAGTPEITIEDAYDPETGAYTLTVRQHTPPTPGQDRKEPLTIPLAVGLLDQSGNDMAATLDGSPVDGTTVLTVSESKQSFRFEHVASAPIPSLLRGFSAPVKLAAQPRDRLLFLYGHDSDPFARWEAGQQLASQLLLEMVAAHQRGEPLALDADFTDAFARTLADGTLDRAFVAEALSLPGEAYLADQMTVVDVDAIHAARSFARREIASKLGDLLRETYAAHHDDGPYVLSPDAIGRRALKNQCLAYLASRSEDSGAIALASGQFRNGGNMTDVQAALSILRDIDAPARAEALSAFYDKWRHNALVIDTWFTLQAMSCLPGTLSEVTALTKHPDFDWRNPNRVRSLIAAFATGNQVRFHGADGDGYALLADAVLTVEALNPQLAARLLVPLGRWRRQDPGRQELMKAALERILAVEGLSPNVYEIASKSLA